jgi:glycosyltransferase involved in cell wall biosynthesis
VVRPEQWFDGRLREVEELAFNGAFLAAALRVAREFRPGAVYQRYTAFNFGGALLSRLLRIPLVLEFNSSDLWKGRHWREFHMLGLAEIGERVNLRAADRVVAVSHVLRDELVARGVPAEKVIVNPNAADPRQFRPDVPADEVRLAHGLVGRTVVGFSGTFGVWHGIPTLAAALPIVAAERPEVAFLLVGDGPLHHLVDEAVTRHGLHGRVALPGLVPHKQMPAYLAACDVLVSPHGRQADGRPFFGSPTKLYEYMASGRAIVASQVGQIGEVLRHGETALLVPPEDPEALAGAILNLVDDQALRARLGAAARAQAVREHTWLQNARGVLSSLDRESIQRTRSGDHPVPGAVIARNLANEARRGRDQRRADMDFLPRTHSQSRH